MKQSTFNKIFFTIWGIWTFGLPVGLIGRLEILPAGSSNIPTVIYGGSAIFFMLTGLAVIIGLLKYADKD